MKTKRQISLVLVVVLIILSTGSITASAAGGSIKVLINGNPADISPIMLNGRILVPLRSVSESIGAKVSWDKDTNVVVVSKGMRTIRLNFGESVELSWAKVNDEFIDLDVPAQVIKGKTYVPVRLIGEGLGADVKWDPATFTVSIVLNEPKELEGLAATVRDAAYTTLAAESARFNVDAQFKVPPIPQLNIIKISGSRDLDGTVYGNGPFSRLATGIVFIQERCLCKKPIV